jgi:hypothetical protein
MRARGGGMIARIMTFHCADFLSVRHSAELGTVRAKTRIEQWQGFASRFYAIGTVPKVNCAKPSHSSQPIDYKWKSELCNCAPLKGG